MRKVRLYIEGVPLREGMLVSCDKKQSHYLVHVMRVEVGAEFAVFNGQDGLWKACVQEASKKACVLEMIECIELQEQDHQKGTSQENSRDIHLCFAPLKQAPQHFLIEKGTELGVTHFHPVLTERTVVRAFKADKQKLTAIEACEQCERLDVPQFSELQNLDKFLSTLSAATDVLYVCDERRESETLLESYDSSKKIHILIGPEGGFSSAEFEMLQRHPATQLIRLSPYILRAETAAVAVLSQVSLMGVRHSS